MSPKKDGYIITALVQVVSFGAGRNHKEKAVRPTGGRDSQGVTFWGRAEGRGGLPNNSDVTADYNEAEQENAG